MRPRDFRCYVAVAIAFWMGLACIVGSPTWAQPQPPQLPQLPRLQVPQPLTGTPSTAIGCVYLDGRCILELAASPMELSGRLAEVEARVRAAARHYRQSGANTPLQVYAQSSNGLTDIRAAVGDRDTRLLTVTALDAETQGLRIEALTRNLERDLQNALARSRQERERPYLQQRGRDLAIAIAAVAGAHLLLSWVVRRLQALKLRLAKLQQRVGEPVTSQIHRKGSVNLVRLARQLVRLLQVGLWLGLGLYGTSLFPQTRPLQGALILLLRVPLRIGLVAAATWVVARLSFAAIDRFTAAFCDNTLLAPQESWRLQLRLTTISGVSKGVVGVAWGSIGTLVALAAIGIDIGPILAGAGILGLGISLASQSLIRDAINGFFIILEDQYGVGDAISLNENIGGLVENMNLRITQLRDIEGRLITIPNSEIRIIANLSSNWSRCDLKVPLAYHADTDRAIEIVRGVLQGLWQNPEWSGQILEKPEILGVDEFTDRGIILRILIKTQPLKQFPVARESRRRIKVALEAAGISLAVAQERLWIENGAGSPSPLQSIDP